MVGAERSVVMVEIRIGSVGKISKVGILWKVTLLVVYAFVVWLIVSR